MAERKESAGTIINRRLAAKHPEMSAKKRYAITRAILQKQEAKKAAAVALATE